MTAGVFRNRLENVIIEYAEELSGPSATSSRAADLLGMLEEQSPGRGSQLLVELTVIIATANATTRIVNALGIEEEEEEQRS